MTQDKEIATIHFINDEYTLWESDDGTWAIQGINGHSGRVVRDSEYANEEKARKMWDKLVARLEEKQDLRFTKTFRKPKTYRSFR